MMTESPFHGYIHANYIPTDDEITLIKALIGSRRATVQGIDEEMKVLVARREVEMTFIDDHDALISPVRRLPDDILSTIFLACMDYSSGGQAWPGMSNKHPAVVISHVCRHWRQLSLDTHLLWSVIDINPPVYPDTPNPNENPPSIESIFFHQADVAQWAYRNQIMLDIAATWFSRSGECPLKLKFTAADKTILIPPEGDTETPYSSHLATLVDLICSTSRRWQDASFHLGVIQPMRSPLLRIAHIPYQEVPLLQKLALNIYNNALDDWGMIAPADSNAWRHNVDPSGILHAQTLHSVEITPTVYLHIASPFLAPRANWAGLMDFSMIKEEYQTFSFRAADALTFLGTCSRLVRCALYFKPRDLGWGAEPPDTPYSMLSRTTHPRVSLPYLQSLTIRGAVPKGFASGLDLPSLHTLSIISWTIDPQDVSANDLVEWFGTFGEQLTNVTLDYSPLTPSVLSRCLLLVPNAIELALHGSFHGPNYFGGWGAPAPSLGPVLNDEVMRGLTPKLRGSLTPPLDITCLCPRLLKFSAILNQVGVEMTPTALVEFMVARRRQVPRDQKPTSGGTARITHVFVKWGLGVRRRMGIKEELSRRMVIDGSFVFKERYWADTSATDHQALFEEAKASW